MSKFNVTKKKAKYKKKFKENKKSKKKNYGNLTTIIRDKSIM